MHDLNPEERNQLKEARVHGTVLLPLANYDNYRRFQRFSRYSIDVHWHDEMELLTIAKGRALFRLDDDDFEIGQDDCVVVPPGAIHSAEAINGNPFCFETVVFNPIMLQASTADQSTLEYINTITAGRAGFLNPIVSNSASDGGGEQPTFHSLIYTLIQLNEEKPTAFSLGLKSALFQFLYQIYRQNRAFTPTDNPRNRQALDRLKPVLMYIKKNYPHRITEDHLAEIANLSKYHFIRVFKRVTGRTPVDYINFYRILVAQRLLEQSDDKVLTIALAVGFNDLSYFYRIFERYNAKPPGAYRRPTYNLHKNTAK